MLNEAFDSSKGAEGVSIDILEISRRREHRDEAKEDPDATENSSSFADTISGNESKSGLSDVEVESQFFGDTDLAPPFDGLGSVFPVRKKKLISHWRNFIHPLMWRCKWAELRIKELESQASKYDKELAALERRKHMALDQTTVEQSGSKSLLFTHQSRRKRSLKRRKRKRVEDTTDIASYMSQQNKRSDLEGVPKRENFGNSDQHMTGQDEFGINSDCAFPEDNDSFLECMLQKIELVHARVHKLKSQLDTIMIKNAGKFYSSENLSQLIAGDAQTSSAHSPMFSDCNGDTVSVGDFIGNIGDFIGDIGDFIMPDSAVSSFGEAIPIPDIIESTVGLLCSIDVTHHQAQVGDSSEKIVDNIFIQNEAAELEHSAFKYSLNQNAEKTREAEHSREEESNKAVVNQKQPTLKPCLSSEVHFPTNKRKRGERKAGPSNWAANGLVNLTTNNLYH